MDALRGNDWAKFTPPWAKVSEIGEFLNLRRTSCLTMFVYRQFTFILTVDSESNEVIEQLVNSNKLELV